MNALSLDITVRIFQTSYSYREVYTLVYILKLCSAYYELLIINNSTKDLNVRDEKEKWKSQNYISVMEVIITEVYKHNIRHYNWTAYDIVSDTTYQRGNCQLKME